MAHIAITMTKRDVEDAIREWLEERVSDVKARNRIVEYSWNDDYSLMVNVSEAGVQKSDTEGFDFTIEKG